MYLDACAIIAILSDERKAQRISDAIAKASSALTSPIAILEAAIGLARPDKLNTSVEKAGEVILEFLDERGIELRDMPAAAETTRLALYAAHRFSAGRSGLNLGDCLHYACAKFYRVPILATDDEFRQTDLETVP
ncbi:MULTISPECIES: type II toxin-antitoxin system VapC family toxin [Sphingomonas]|jgi:ribonuclease VapC|uniref:Ribonuclease VapC n=1 Tax=Sphingomonas turrisvirgatae TaxID=1888892 RepID=A0A1E3LYJ7_9SPHN|nr:type II toxin-antitoxin system VapC family toxin [Sphingomonas turrisvirgatae]ODP38821.1 twitching motility protein PilT [Sphingomonas turrisvirgatae]